MERERSSSISMHESVAIEWLRGWAIVGVIAIHSTAAFAALRVVNTLTITLILSDVLAHYAVPLFVAISGFVLAARYPALRTSQETRAFYRRRLGAILLPYLVFSLVYTVIALVRGNHLTPGNVALNLLGGNAQYHLWYIVLIVQLYLLFPILQASADWFTRLGRPGAWLFLTLLIQLAWNVFALLTRPASGQPLWADLLLGYRAFPSHLFYFCAGMCLARDRARMQAWTRYPLPAALVAAALALFVTLNWADAIQVYGSFFAAPARHFVLPTLVEPALYAAIVLLFVHRAEQTARAGARFAPLVVELGVYSFGIYLVHELFRMGLVAAFHRAGLTAGDPVFVPLLFSLTLLMSFASIKWVSGFALGARLVGVRRNARTLVLAPGSGAG